MMRIMATCSKSLTARARANLFAVDCKLSLDSKPVKDYDIVVRKDKDSYLNDKLESLVSKVEDEEGKIIWQC